MSYRQRKSKMSRTNQLRGFVIVQVLSEEEIAKSALAVGFLCALCRRDLLFPSLLGWAH